MKKATRLMSLKNTTLVIAVVFAVKIFAIQGCDGFSEKKQAENNLEKISLGLGSGLFLTPIWVAEKKGYFHEEGLDLTIKEFVTGNASFLSMLEGDVDISTLAPTPIMFASFNRADYSIFATFAVAEENVKVIARKDAGILAPNDLVGKKVGTTAKTSAQFVLSSFLFYNGIDTSQIIEVNIRPPDLPGAIRNNQVDAIVIWEPFAHDALTLLQGNAICFPNQRIYKELFNFVVMKNLARKKPELLEKFLRAIDKATKYIQTNSEEAKNIVTEKLQLSNKIMTDIWDDYTFELSLRQSLLIRLEDEARWATKVQMVQGNDVPDYLDYVFIDALKKIKPESITIIE